MNLTKNDKLMSDIGKISNQIRVISQDPDSIKFRLDATLSEIYHLRRFFHLNYDLRVLVTTEALASLDSKLEDVSDLPISNEKIQENYGNSAKWPVQFTLEPRQVKRDVSRPEYLNLFLDPNPVYENVGAEHSIPPSWDNVSLEEKDTEIDDLFA